MISHERGLYVITGGITFTQLFENVICRPKSIFFYDTTVKTKAYFLPSCNFASNNEQQCT